MRKLVFGTFCAIGGLGGLWFAMWTTEGPDRPGDPAADLVRMLEPLLARFGIGLAAGVAAGLAFCLTVLRPPRRRET